MREYEYQMNSDWQKSIRVKPVLFDIAEDLMVFCITYPPLLLIGRFFEKGAGLYFKLIILLLSMLAMTMSRKKAKRIYIFALSLCAIAASVAFLPLNLPVKIEVTGAVLVAAAVSVSRLRQTIRRKRSKEDPTMQSGKNAFFNGSVLWVGVPCFYITHMISKALGRREMLAVCLVCMGTLFFCYAVYIHKIGTFRLLELNRDQPFFPNKISGFSRFFVFYAAIASAIIGTVSYLLVRFTGLGMVDDWILYILTYTKAAGKFKPVPMLETQTPIDFTAILRQIGIQPTPRFLLILDRVLETAFWMICIALALLGFSLTLRLLIRLLKKSRDPINEEVRSTLSIREVTDELAARIRKSKIAVLFTGSSNNMKIRKIYYHLIKKYQMKGIPITRTDSPTEIGVKIETSTGTKMQDATQIYQKARYGFNDCDRQDVERIKKMRSDPNLK